ncbi:MAG: hypothetical protein HY535_07295 [Chloroflexi bacterium]|nr:hypothetical protein [Chloroflexota bacterium]
MVGATTIQPGASTTLALPLFMGMHKGMEEEHVFAVDIRSNDPTQAEKTLRWRFVPKELVWTTWMREAADAHE